MNEFSVVSRPGQEFNYFKMSNFNVCEEKDVLAFDFRLSFHQVFNFQRHFWMEKELIKSKKKAGKKETVQSNLEAKHIPFCTPFCAEK